MEIDTEVESFEIIEFDIALEVLFVVFLQRSFQTFVLECPIESFHMCIIIRLPYTGISMAHITAFDPIMEELPEFRSMIRLEHTELKDGVRLSFLEKSDARPCIDALVYFGIAPP